ncbi:MAG: hypothetical protein H0T54_00755, partial [Geodermatophilaceae bacterium]|nr:hypothetical protein [Geodermatophilaceae bacterium]
MVSISRESWEQTEQRLRGVIAAAEFVTLDGTWAFREAARDQPPELNEQVLAVVRDDESWSWLTTAAPSDDERFAVFSFHFPYGLDNSGFVGWLGSVLKHELGTGVFVVCGQNSRRGG